MAVIGCDVDYTVVDLMPTWWRWLEGITNTEKDIKSVGEVVDYNLGMYFAQELDKVNRCGLDFYRQDGLYDTLKPDPISVKVLQTLHNAGHEIVFVSAIKGRHTKSKAEFLKRNFPFLSGIVYTKEKQYVSCEVFIDDRAENINKSKAPIKIFLETNIKQWHDLEVPCVRVCNWQELGYKVCRHLDIDSNEWIWAKNIQR